MPIVSLTTPTNQQSQALTAAMQLAGAEKVHIGLHRDAQEGQALATWWAVGVGTVETKKWKWWLEKVPRISIQRGWFLVFFYHKKRSCIYLFLDSIVYDLWAKKTFTSRWNSLTSFVFFVKLCFEPVLWHLRRQPADYLGKSKKSATIITVVDIFKLPDPPKPLFWNYEKHEMNKHNVLKP